MFKTSIFIAAVAAAAFAAVDAEAEDFVFHFDRDALASAAGAEAVYERLIERADAYCDGDEDRGLWRRRAEAACMSRLVDLSVAEIGDQNLAAAHTQSVDIARLADRR